MSKYLRQAKLLLDTTEVKDAPVLEAKEILAGLDDLDKVAGDGLLDPKLTNAINLLTPFVVNYKVNQVLKLLKELADENKKKELYPGIKVKI